VMPPRSLLSPRCWLIRLSCCATLKYPSLSNACRWCLATGSYAICTEIRGITPGWATSQRTCWRHVAAELIHTRREHPDVPVYAIRYR
jgi:hypothetical protein